MATHARAPARGVAPARGPTEQPPAAGLAAAAQDVLERIGLRELPIAIRFWDGTELRGSAAASAAVHVRDPRAVQYLLHAPNELGLARSWVTGALDVTGELEAVVELHRRLRELRPGLLDRARLGLAAVRLLGRGALQPPPVPAAEARADGRLHSLRRDREAVTHHYDISNRFYELLLGPTLTYSCAYFGADDESLESAQERKLELICSKLRLAPGERLLDIGCGWGSLLLHAAHHHGVRGVGITLSDAQAQRARERVRESGLSDQIEIRVADYRTLGDGPYDKVASVGMYEHVGIRHYYEYARVVRSLLRPGGLFLNDGIARLFAAPRRGATFINRYVFPDGELHPLPALLESVEAAGLEVRGVQSLREHYGRTLRRWYANLHAHRAQALEEVGSERVRVWELYILGSALAFEDGEITNYHVLAERG
jgi:cyclopropane-fatty-acyl-phospholipid synthase